MSFRLSLTVLMPTEYSGGMVTHSLIGIGDANAFYAIAQCPFDESRQGRQQFAWPSDSTASEQAGLFGQFKMWILKYNYDPKLFYPSYFTWADW